MSWLRCTTRIASGIASPSAWAGIAVAVPALEREAQRLANAGAEVEPLHEHVGDLAPGREVVDRPLAGRLLDHADDLVALLRARPAVAKAITSRITSVGFAASWTSVWARIAISSPNTVATSWAWPVQPT